jgi:hypothetical protein
MSRISFHDLSASCGAPASFAIKAVVQVESRGPGFA